MIEEEVIVNVSSSSSDSYVQNPPTIYEDELREVCLKYEINECFAEKIRALEGYEIVIVIDDSGSMNTVIDSQCPYGRANTRWQELKITTSIVIEIATVLDHNGVDVYFLNREPILGVKSASELDYTFSIPPKGYTPIVATLRKIISKKSETPRLIIIATDGEPTDQRGQTNIPEFRRVLERERNRNDYVTILACTDNDDTMDYLNDWDVKIPHLDVVDDYVSEKKEILAVQGNSFPFSFGDYVVKALMGGVDSWFDNLDEVKVTRRDGTIIDNKGKAFNIRSNDQGSSSSQSNRHSRCNHSSDQPPCVLL